MAKNTHLTLEDRIIIEVSLKNGESFAEIGRKLEKDPSTISKEVRNHIKIVRNKSYNPCANRASCSKIATVCKSCSAQFRYLCKRCVEYRCYELCTDFVELTCQRLKKPPYICDNCIRRMRCKLERHLYIAKNAQDEYEAMRSESRQGISVSAEELNRIDQIVSPLIKQRQSIHMICVNHADEIMLDEKTIYNYIDAGLLSVRNIDLPRKVRYRKRPKKKTVKVDKACFRGRSYEDFQNHLAADPDVPVVEMDSVIGSQGGKVLLTIYFRTSSLMLAFLRDANTARSVSEIFEHLYEVLGHEMIRRILPQGTSFDALKQKDIDLMMSHINSYTRKKLNNQSAYELFSFLHGQEILEKLKIKEIPADKINMTPLLLKIKKTNAIQHGNNDKKRGGIYLCEKINSKFDLWFL